jgi:hypothetical protein
MPRPTEKPPLVVQRNHDSTITLDRASRTEFSAIHAEAGLLGIVGSVAEAEALIRAYRERQAASLGPHAERVARLREAVAAAEAVLGL